MLPPRSTDTVYSTFEELDRALKSIGVNVDAIYEAVAAILHLCNIQFGEDSSKNSTILNNTFSKQALFMAAKLLQTDVNRLIYALTNQEIKAGSESNTL